MEERAVSGGVPRDPGAADAAAPSAKLALASPQAGQQGVTGGQSGEAVSRDLDNQLNAIVRPGRAIRPEPAAESAMKDAPAAPLVSPKQEESAEAAAASARRETAAASPPPTSGASGQLSAAPPTAPAPAVTAPAGSAAAERSATTPAGQSAARFDRMLAKSVMVPFDIGSPDAVHRWRLDAGGALQHSSSGGASWQPVSLARADVLTAGHSPAGSVCWLVGRLGAVWLTTDGVRFDRRPVADPVDLISIRATDALHATVVTAAGGALATADGGVTWTPAAP
jgi:hypothetical protein